MNIVTQCFKCDKGQIQIMGEVHKKQTILEFFCTSCGSIFEIPAVETKKDKEKRESIEAYEKEEREAENRKN